MRHNLSIKTVREHTENRKSFDGLHATVGVTKPSTPLLRFKRVSVVGVALITLVGLPMSIGQNNPVAAAEQSTSKPAVEKQIRPLEILWLESLKTANDEALNQLISPSFAYQHPSGNTYTKAEVIDAFTGSKRITVAEYGPISLRFHKLSDTVISYGEHTIAGTLDGQPYSGKMRFVNTWNRRSTGKWQLVHRMSEIRQLP
jgi:hypothetical protein